MRHSSTGINVIAPPLPRRRHLASLGRKATRRAAHARCLQIVLPGTRATTPSSISSPSDHRRGMVSSVVSWSLCHHDGISGKADTENGRLCLPAACHTPTHYSPAPDCWLNQTSVCRQHAFPVDITNLDFVSVGPPPGITP